MKRRRILQSLVALPAATLPASALAQTAPLPPPTAVPVEVPLPKPTLTNAEAIAADRLTFFSTEQFLSLRRLAELIVPAGGGNPGASEAKAPEFLDFLLSRSPADRQSLYKQGLDKLNRDSRQKYAKTFDALEATQAAVLLAPLQTVWTYEGPADPFVRFLGAAKEDLLQATRNSRQWAMADTRGRGAAGMGMYWFPIE